MVNPPPAKTNKNLQPILNNKGTATQKAQAMVMAQQSQVSKSNVSP